MKQCLECGTFSSDDTTFCSVCGKRFSGATELPVVENNQSVNEQTHNYDEKITSTTHPEIVPLLQRVGLFWRIMSLTGLMNTVNVFLIWNQLMLMPILENFLWNSDAPHENN